MLLPTPCFVPHPSDSVLMARRIGLGGLTNGNARRGTAAEPLTPPSSRHRLSDNVELLVGQGGDPEHVAAAGCSSGFELGEGTGLRFCPTAPCNTPQRSSARAVGHFDKLGQVLPGNDVAHAVLVHLKKADDIANSQAQPPHDYIYVVGPLPFEDEATRGGHSTRVPRVTDLFA